jgi:hypothetical protein
MFVVVTLVICLTVGFVGGSSRVGKVGWLGAAAAAITLAVVAFAYRSDARKLPEWFEKRNELLTLLRVNRICLDMETHPEHWQGTGLEYPCIGYSADQVRDQIAEQEGVLEDWNRAIRDRQPLLRARKTGLFWFIQKWVGDPYE